MGGARTLNTAFSAGALGGLANGLALWVFGVLGITTGLGVQLAPALTPMWLYPRIVWGGIWGALFLVPFLERSIFWRGLILSLGPTIVQLVVVFPLKLHQGMFGLGVGALTPLFVVILNGVWGVCAAWWVRVSEAGGAEGRK